MIFIFHTRTRHYRRLAKRLGYIKPMLRRTAKSVPAIMNGELEDMQADIRAASLAPEIYSNKPDPDWLGTTSPDFNDEVINA